jgi:hypothetical protein
LDIGILCIPSPSMSTLPTFQSHDPSLLERLTQTGVLGIFNFVEVTSVIAHHKPSKRTVNVLTHLITVEQSALPNSPPRLQKINFSKLADWSFGITRHGLPLTELADRLHQAIDVGHWTEEKGSLNFGALRHQGHWFVPPSECIPMAPLNRLLKNNFWNGSHIWEWSPQDKTDFLPFFEKPILLQSLSDGITEHLPIQLASLSDKLGNLILQVPVTCLVSDYHGTGHADGNVVCEVKWHPDVEPRRLVITAERWHDGLLSHFYTEIGVGNQATLQAQEGPAGLKAVIRDTENDVVLGAMEVNILSSIHFGMHVRHPASRTFTERSLDNKQSRAVSVEVDSLQQSVVGDPNRLAHFNDTRKRIYHEEMRVLREQREFIQYRPDYRDENGQILERAERHRRALEDLRYLIKHYGQVAVWVWDPYLDARDLLKTLFYNQHAGSAMRALTGAEQVKRAEVDDKESETEAQTKKLQFVRDEGTHLDQCSGNREGLHLEFRAKVGAAGFAFHDRFLIFPHAEPEPLAWSLGISVNAMGKEHHILQKVPNGRLIADAFQDLWDDLDQPEQLIWKAP